MYMLRPGEYIYIHASHTPTHWRATTGCWCQAGGPPPSNMDRPGPSVYGFILTWSSGQAGDG